MTKEEIVKQLEKLIRAYDPCLACATHILLGNMPVIVKIFNKNKNLIKQIS